MNAILRMEDWAEHHHPKAMDFLRIVLGLVLIFRGFSFATHEDLIHSLILNNTVQYFTFMGSQYLILISIGGGILIAFGLLTRFAAIINLPILFVEIFFVRMPAGLLPVNRDLVYSVIVFALLLVFLVFGSGEFSTDHYIKNHKDIW